MFKKGFIHKCHTMVVFILLKGHIDKIVLEFDWNSVSCNIYLCKIFEGHKIRIHLLRKKAGTARAGINPTCPFSTTHNYGLLKIINCHT